MENNDLEPQAFGEPEEYIIAEGLAELYNVLESFLDKSQKDREFASKGHFILYKLGSQNSLIKVDMSRHPYMFYYHDLLGRPITRGVKKTIVNFLWEKCGLKERYNESLEEE